MYEYPQWLKKRLIINDNLFGMKRILAEYSINTVCESSLCPNLNECFSRKWATFLILGEICSRACTFCSVRHDLPGKIDSAEPEKISNIVKRLDLRYVVITSVTRDDLYDGGSGQFVKVVEAIRDLSKDVRIELLVPDFVGKRAAIERVIKIGPDIFGHNIETVQRLYSVAKAGSDYYRSLGLLRMAKGIDSNQLTKSGIMVGLGETEEEVIKAMKDLRRAQCDILTIGQYLRPGKYNPAVKEFITPEEFKKYKIIGEELGFKLVSSGPFVRSSYFAEEIYNRIRSFGCS